MDGRKIVSARELLEKIERDESASRAQSLTPIRAPRPRSTSRPSATEWLQSVCPSPGKDISSPRTPETASAARTGLGACNFSSPEIVEESKHSAARKRSPYTRGKSSASPDPEDILDEKKATSPDFDWMKGDLWPKLIRTPFISKEEPLELCKDPCVTIPGHVAKYLRAYQQDGVRWMYEFVVDEPPQRYREGRGGVLADDMGLGKTVQVAALLLAVMGKSGTSSDMTPPVSLERHPAERRAFVVCPASLCQQWKAELLTWSFFHVRVFGGAEKDTAIAAARCGHLEILIASYEGYREHSEALNQVDWSLVVFDEAHRIKDHTGRIAQAARALRSRVRFGLTGTAMQNNMMELWCLLDWAVPNCLGDPVIFKREFQRVMVMGQRSNAAPHEVQAARRQARKLKTIIDNHMLRREKVLIADQFPGKEDLICICPMAPLQAQVYERVLSHPDYSLLRDHALPCPCGAMNERRRLKRSECCYATVQEEDLELFQLGKSEARWSEILLPALTQLLKICNHLDLVRYSHRDPEEKQQKDRKFARVAFDSDDDAVIAQSDTFRGLSDDSDCGKMQVLTKLLKHWYYEKSKVLLFSYSVRMLDILDRLMVRLGHKRLRLDGDTPTHQRLRLVNEFNENDEIFVLLISTRAGGLGLNLASANIVVVADPNWNPAFDLQAQDRAFRIGQRRHVKVFRLISAGSIEEQVYMRQVYKQQAANMAIKASHERRYYTGAQGIRGQEGELFGVANLLRFQPSVAAASGPETGRLLSTGAAETSGQNVDYKIVKMPSVVGMPATSPGPTGSACLGNGLELGGLEVADEEGLLRLVGEKHQLDIAERVSDMGTDENRELGGCGSRNGAPSVDGILAKLCQYRHKHDDIVGESPAEVSLAARLDAAADAFSEAASASAGRDHGDPAGKNSRTPTSQSRKRLHEALNTSPSAPATSPRSKSPRDGGDAATALEHRCRQRFQMSLEEFARQLKATNDKSEQEGMLKALQAPD